MGFLRSFLKLLLILLTVIAVFSLVIHILFDGIFTGPIYHKEDLIENYEEKKLEILEAKKYIESILPQDAIVHIEFRNKEELGIFHVAIGNFSENNWNLKFGSSKTDSLLTILGWTYRELNTLKHKLDQAGCISISSRKPVSLGWKRSGMGIYSYTLLDGDLNDSLIAEYNNGCSYIYYKENVVLEYGGGAIGPQCFPGNN